MILCVCPTEVFKVSNDYYYEGNHINSFNEVAAAAALS